MKSETPIIEQEVTINIYPKQVDEYADVYSSIPAWTERLRKLSAANPDMTSVSDLDPGIIVRVPRDWIKVRPPHRVTMTDEQKRQNSERLKAYRESKSMEGRNDGSV